MRTHTTPTTEATSPVTQDPERLTNRQRELEAKRERLLRELEEVEEHLGRLQSDSRHGQSVKLASVGRLRLKKMTIETQLEGVDTEAGDVERTLERLHAWGPKADAVARLVELAAEGNRALEGFYSALASVRLGAHSGALVEAYGELKRVRLEFVRLASRLAPGLTRLVERDAHGDALEARRLYEQLDGLKQELEAHGADLTAVRMRFDPSLERTVWDENKVLPGL